MQAHLIDSGCEQLTGRVEAPIGWLTFNNPARRNAVSVEMWAAVPKVLGAFENDDAVRAVVVTGAGDKAFVSGADISQFEKSRSDQAENEEYKALSGGARNVLATLPKPTIAMIRGFCIGGGLAVALSCDLRLCSSDAVFGIPAARLGLGYDFAGVSALTTLVGPAFAREMLFTARRLTAEEALQIGLVNKVLPRDELEGATREYAAMMARNAPLTLKAAKLAVAAAVQDPADRDMQAVNSAIDACFNSADYAEGRKAFMEKRDPSFRGV